MIGSARNWHVVIQNPHSSQTEEFLKKWEKKKEEIEKREGGEMNINKDEIEEGEERKGGKEGGEMNINKDEIEEEEERKGEKEEERKEKDKGWKTWEFNALRHLKSNPLIKYAVMGREHWSTTQSLFEQHIIAPSKTYTMDSVNGIFEAMRKGFIPQKAEGILDLP